MDSRMLPVRLTVCRTDTNRNTHGRHPPSVLLVDLELTLRLGPALLKEMAIRLFLLRMVLEHRELARSALQALLLARLRRPSGFKELAVSLAARVVFVQHHGQRRNV